MDTAVNAARIGNCILRVFAALMILLMLSYGGYSLWDSFMISRGAFLSGDLLKYKPTGGLKDQVSLEELMAINKDVLGWLTIDDTSIDYPLVQGETDMDYLNQDVRGNFSFSGSIFLSCLNQPDFTDSYSLIYGHNVDTGGMFADVKKFTESEFFETHRTGTLYLKNQSLKVELFACMEADGYDRIIYAPGKECDMEELLGYLAGNSVCYREIGVTSKDRIIGMSTCENAQTNGRIILFGRLVEE
ncbi:class B sortase [Lacrimispora sp. JR3]|uniref:class B sortase n=1 Tax=Lacrimispora sinapis TaxID=3111456 RepID=UPI003748F420